MINGDSKTVSSFSPYCAGQWQIIMPDNDLELKTDHWYGMLE
ncbi:Uncharacterised protein [Proteus mirabilis]|uniref:Uncharacterized protein n=1 Tax=Proteus mirabilis TaxID=584 RepID=A0A379FF03_PROMI|nr:Uncharacterised protein [Proteus mirabilis]